MALVGRNAARTAGASRTGDTRATTIRHRLYLGSDPCGSWLERDDQRHIGRRGRRPTNVAPGRHSALASGERFELGPGALARRRRVRRRRARPLRQGRWARRAMTRPRAAHRAATSMDVAHPLSTAPLPGNLVRPGWFRRRPEGPAVSAPLTAGSGSQFAEIPRSMFVLRLTSGFSPCPFRALPDSTNQRAESSSASAADRGE